ncbi:hypothetical protein [Sporanaerobium hydrogeniformans]|uniref:hypothetical protein n=1 Tax=Sporanaerobium hydrogeniformans TaxID=3072179 RepID=UPI0015D50FF9|nr:hypothetical protein [Sporanaerobium hydrogeniformans]
MAKTYELKWLYAGPFKHLPEIEKLIDFKSPIETAVGTDYWRVDQPKMWIRPFKEEQEL